jgi:Kef-type K+ transport system membrane component KefB
LIVGTSRKVCAIFFKGCEDANSILFVFFLVALADSSTSLVKQISVDFKRKTPAIIGILLLVGLIQSLVYSIRPLAVAGLYIDASHPIISILGPVLYLFAISLVIVVHYLASVSVMVGSKVLIAFKGYWLAQ